MGFEILIVVSIKRKQLLSLLFLKPHGRSIKIITRQLVAIDI